MVSALVRTGRSAARIVRVGSIGRHSIVVGAGRRTPSTGLCPRVPVRAIAAVAGAAAICAVCTQTKPGARAGRFVRH